MSFEYEYSHKDRKTLWLNVEYIFYRGNGGSFRDPEGPCVDLQSVTDRSGKDVWHKLPTRDKEIITEMCQTEGLRYG